MKTARLTIEVEVTAPENLPASLSANSVESASLATVKRQIKNAISGIPANFAKITLTEWEDDVPVISLESNG